MRKMRCSWVRSVLTLTPSRSEAAARSWPSTIRRASRICAGERPIDLPRARDPPRDRLGVVEGDQRLAILEQDPAVERHPRRVLAERHRPGLLRRDVQRALALQLAGTPGAPRRAARRRARGAERAGGRRRRRAPDGRASAPAPAGSSRGSAPPRRPRSAGSSPPRRCSPSSPCSRSSTRRRSGGGSCSWRLRSSPVSMPIWSKVTQATFPSTTTFTFSHRTRPSKACFFGNRSTICSGCRAAIASQPSSTRTPSEAKAPIRRVCGDCTQWLAKRLEVPLQPSLGLRADHCQDRRPVRLAVVHPTVSGDVGISIARPAPSGMGAASGLGNVDQQQEDPAAVAIHSSSRSPRRGRSSRSVCSRQ